MRILLVTEDAARDRLLIEGLEARGHEIYLSEIAGRNMMDPDMQGDLPQKVEASQGVIVTASRALNKYADVFLQDLVSWAGKSRHIVLYAHLEGTAQEDVAVHNKKHSQKVGTVYPSATPVDKAPDLIEACLRGQASGRKLP